MIEFVIRQSYMVGSIITITVKNMHFVLQ